MGEFLHWKKGDWGNGTWENGEWNQGTWEDGTWEDGTWKKGQILDKKTNKFINSKNPPQE